MDRDSIQRVIDAALLGLTPDQACTVLMEHIIMLTTTHSPSLAIALSIIQGFTPDLESAVKEAWTDQHGGTLHT